MNDFANATKCSVEEPRRETAKELLENMGAILRELNNEVRMISDAVYRGRNCNPVEEEPNEPKMPPMVAIMREQRDVAEEVLKELVRIREALW